MHGLEFFVEGKPQTAGSKSAIPGKGPGGRPLIVESGDRAAKRFWREDVRAGARRALEGVEGWDMAGPFFVSFTFCRLRPKSHYGSGRNADLVKSSAPEFPVSRPDLLKQSRAVEDALTSVVWHDDAAIVDERLRKVFGPREGCWITVARVGDVGWVTFPSQALTVE